MNDEFSPDAALVEDFLVESAELLEGIDGDLVALESRPQDADLLNRIFRALHTIKGTSGFLGFDPVVRLSHRAEDVLNALRRGEAQLSHRSMDALLATRDQLGVMLRDIREGGLKQYSLDSLLADLDAAQKPPAKALSFGETLVPEKVIPPEAQNHLLTEQAEPETPRKPAGRVVQKKHSAHAPVGNALADPKKTSESGAAAVSSGTAQTMRVDAHKLDDLINLIGELVLERNRLVRIGHDRATGKIPSAEFDSVLAQTTARLSFITDELQSAGLKTRMVPIETVFRKFPRMVRDIARDLQKDAQLLIRGEDTELDKTMVELIGDPLVHLVRNSLDHGLENPDTREKAGKPRQGTVRLEASQEGDQVVIRISDDGGGINPERVGRKAVEKGLVTAERLRQLSEREIFDFIFMPGFSTAEKTTDLSGRGVGLDVVRTNLTKLNGSVEIESKLGIGTTVSLRLPLTLMILPVLLVQAGEEVYAIPLHSVMETAQVEQQHVHRVEGSEVLCLRNETLPLIRLRQLLQIDSLAAEGSNGARTNLRKAVILGVADKHIALLVDHLLGQESTVVKPLGIYLHRCSSLAGATISGDGRVRLVLDPAGLIAASRNHSPDFREASA